MIIAWLLAFFLPLSLTWLSTPYSPQVFGSKSINRVKTKDKVVALTYDDGPVDGFTSDLLDVLKKHKVQATFFVMGKRAQEHPELVVRAYGEGHEIGNHTWSHPVLIGKSFSFVREQIEDTDAVIRELGYKGEIHFRSPHGAKLYVLPRILANMRRPNILFDVMVWDWTGPGTQKIINGVMEQVRSGSIILLHDGCGKREQTVPATDEIIRRLKAQGYRFVTVSELLKYRK